MGVAAARVSFKKRPNDSGCGHGRPRRIEEVMKMEIDDANGLRGTGAPSVGLWLLS